MLNKTKKITKVLIASGLFMAASHSYAQQQIPFPKIPYTNADMAAAKCDPNVYVGMYNQAKSRYDSQYNSVSELMVKTQVEATPKEATNKMLACVDGALGQLNGLASNIKGLYNMIMGVANLDPAAIGAQAANQLSSLACNAASNYVNSKVYSAVAPYNSAITNIPGQVTGQIGNVGGIDLGGIVNQHVQQQNAGQNNTSTIATDTVNNVLKNGGILK